MIENVGDELAQGDGHEEARVQAPAHVPVVLAHPVEGERGRWVGDYWG